MVILESDEVSMVDVELMMGGDGGGDGD